MHQPNHATFINEAYSNEEDDKKEINDAESLSQNFSRWSNSKAANEKSFTGNQKNQERHGYVRGDFNERSDSDLQTLFRKLPAFKQEKLDEFDVFKNYARGKSDIRPSPSMIDKYAMNENHIRSKNVAYSPTRPVDRAAATAVGKQDTTSQHHASKRHKHSDTTSDWDRSGNLPIPPKNSLAGAISKSTSIGSQNSSKGSYGSGAQQHSVLRSDVFYQNRLICMNQREGKTNSVPSQESHGRNSGSNMGTQVNSANANSDVHFKTGNMRKMEMDASSVTMDARGIEIILTDPDNSSRPIETEERQQENTFWRKVNKLLQDNRMEDTPDSDRILNTDNPEEYAFLKKVLNIAFLTIGIILFLSVIVVVIYAFVD